VVIEEIMKVIHTQSISSKSSDSITKELTTPVPFAALMVISVFPKKMYLVEVIVLARPSEVMINSAPSVPYVMLVPDAAEK
jgi:hypothetical protein